MPQRPLHKLRQGVAIDATGTVFEIKAEYASTIALHLAGDDTADYAVDVSPDGSAWFNSVSTYAGTADIDAVLTRPEAYLRLRVTTPAATAGATAEVYAAAPPN